MQAHRHTAEGDDTLAESCKHKHTNNKIGNVGFKQSSYGYITRKISHCEVKLPPETKKGTKGRRKENMTLAAFPGGQPFFWLWQTS